MPDQREILERIARQAMLAHGLEPDFPAPAQSELSHLHPAPLDGLQDLRALPWSSIDNDDSRDLDQVEVCIQEPNRTRLLVGLADVEALVARDTALDRHACLNTTSVYTPARVFPMLPTVLSTDRTSLNEDQDRAAIIVDMTIGDDGRVAAEDVYRAIVRNHAKLTYHGVGAWLEGKGPKPGAIASVNDLERQVRTQAGIATRLRAVREREGALDFDRTELKPIVSGDVVKDVETEHPNQARDIIEDFMIAANGVTARFLAARKLASIRRVVRSPERWARIVALAAEHGSTLPGEPDARALAAFLTAQRTSAPDDFSELSLAVIKLMGRGEYVADGAAGPGEGHFALAVSNYTHSTAPNRRYPDLITQRLLKAAIARQPPPYTLADLTPLAAHCTTQEDAANKVERLVGKAAAALWLSDRIGDEFDATVTGASAKGTWVRLRRPPIEGKLEKGFEGLDVGDRVRVRLVRTVPERGFIDFVRVR